MRFRCCVLITVLAALVACTDASSRPSSPPTAITTLVPVVIVSPSAPPILRPSSVALVVSPTPIQPSFAPITIPTLSTPGSNLAVKLPDNVPVIEPTVNPGALSSMDWTLFTDINDVHDVAIDRQGYVWSGGGGGVVRWNPVDGTYTRYTIQTGLKQNEGSLLAAAPEGAMWLLTSKYLTRFYNERWTSYEVPTGVQWHGSAVDVAPNGDVWIGTNGPGGGDGLYRFDGQDWSHFTTEQGLVSNEIWTIAITSDGDVLATMTGAIMRFDGQLWTNLERNGQYISVAPDGIMWLGGSRQLMRLDGTGWHTYPIPDGYPVNAIINATTAAPNGILWISSNDLIARFDGMVWTTYTYTVRRDRRAIVADLQGGVWVGTNRGLSHFDGTTWREYKVEGLAGDVGDIATAVDGSVWFGTDIGAIRFDGQTWQTYSTAGRLALRAVAPDGTAWFGTDGDIRRFGGENWVSYLGDIFGTSVTTAIVAPDGTLWCGGYGYGGYLAHFDGTTWTIYKLRRPYWYVDSVTVSSDGDVWALAEADGETQNGITPVRSLAIRFAHGEWTSYELEELGLSDGRQIVAAPDGSVWILAGGGVVRIEGR